MNNFIVHKYKCKCGGACPPPKLPKIYTDDIYFSGKFNRNLNIKKGDKLTNVLDKILKNIQGIFYKIQNTAGHVIDSGTIPINEDLEVTIPDTSYSLVNTQNTLIEQGSIPSTANKKITAPDATVIVRDDSDTVIRNENIASNSTGDIYIQDSLVNLQNTEGGIVATLDIKPEKTHTFVIQDSTYTLKNTIDGTIEQGSILAEGSKEITAPDSQITIQDKFQNVILQDSIPSNNSKTFTVNTELPVKNTTGDEVGTEIDEEIIVGDSNIIVKDSEDNVLINFDVPAENNEEKAINDSTAIIKDSSGNTLKSESILAERSKDITIQDSEVTLKNTKDKILSSENILAEGSKEITAPNSNFKITDFSGNKTFIEGEIASGASEEFEIWAKDYRPLIFKYDTTLSGDNEIILRGTGYYEKHITIKDMQGDILEEYWTTDDNVINTNHPVGEYYVEIRQRDGSYYTSNTNGNRNINNTLTEILQFGDVVWDVGNLQFLYRRCEELIITAKDVMKFRDGVITGLDFAFERIKGVAETTWIEHFPWGKVQGDANHFFSNTPNFAKDTLELDFKDADIFNIGNFFIAYQIGGSNGIQTLIIKNMGSCVNMTGNIIGSSFPWTNGMQKVIFEDLQVSQNMAVWRPTDPINIMLFFLNLGDLTGETQSTITLRSAEWDLLTQEQKDVVEDILVNKNWALSLI